MITRLILHTPNPYTKSEVSSLSCSEDMRCKILKRVTWPRLCPFQGRFFIGRVELAMVNECTKLEVSRFTRYEAMNGGAKCRKWGGLGALKIMGKWQCHHSTECIRLPIHSTLIETMRLPCTVFDIQQAMPKVADFNLPHLHLATQLVEFLGDLWHQKTRVPVLSRG